MYQIPETSALEARGRYTVCLHLKQSLQNRHKWRCILLGGLLFLNLGVHILPMMRSMSSIAISVLAVLFSIAMALLSLFTTQEEPRLLRLLLLGFVLGFVIHAYDLLFAIPGFLVFATQIWEQPQAEWLKTQEGYPDFLYTEPLPEAENPKEMQLNFGRRVKPVMQAVPETITSMPSVPSDAPQAAPIIPAVQDERSNDLTIRVVYEEEEDTGTAGTDAPPVSDFPDITGDIPDLPDVPDLPDLPDIPMF